MKDDHDMQAMKLASAIKPPTPAPPPREPTPADNRRVMEALDGAFDEKSGSYVEVGVSDATLATKLGVPRKWVEDVREKFFGPIKTDPEREKLLAQIEAMRARLKAAIDKAMTAAGEAEAALPEIEAMERRVKEYGGRRG